MQLLLDKRGDYAIRAVRDIAEHHSARRKAREIAASMSIPHRSLSRILAELVRADVLRATAGREGGCELARPPERMALLEVIDAVDRPTQTCW